MAISVFGPSIIDAITIDNSDLHNTPFSQTTDIQDEYILSNLSLSFSTNELKTINLRSNTGIVVWNVTNSATQNFNVVFNEAFNYGDNLTLTISATSSTCLVTGTIKVKPGAILPVEYSIKQRLEDILYQVTQFFGDEEVGSWDYITGVAGTATVPDLGRVLGVSAVASSVIDGSVTINGGPSIAIPKGAGWDLTPKGKLIAPTFVFTHTVTYMVEYLI